jgi:hypothetical protein
MLTFIEAKHPLRVDLDDDDTLINHLINAATTATSNYLDGMTLDATAPAPIKAAALLLLTDLYENRSASTERPLYRNDLFERLLQPYRVLTA